MTNQEGLKPQEERNEEDRSKVDDLRGSPLSVGTLEELIDEKCVCFFCRGVLFLFSAVVVVTRARVCVCV